MRLLAIAELRLREGLAARLAWLVPIAFAVGLGAASWAQGPDAAARAAMADRVALGTCWGLALLVAAIVPTLGLPSDIRTGAAQTLLAAPVSRFAVVLGGTLGYGTFATLLLLAMAGASVLGMQVAGVGTAQREPLRPAIVAELVDAGADGNVALDANAPVAAFRFRVPEGLRPGEQLRVRLAPRARVETGTERSSVAAVSVHRPGDDETSGRQVAFKATIPLTTDVPLGGLRAGEEAEVTFRRLSGGWKFTFPPGSVEIGGPRRLFAAGLVMAGLCAVPLLFLLAAIGSLGAARFGAPTAVTLAAFLFLVFVGRTLIVDAAQFVVTSAAEVAARPHVDEPDPGHAEHPGHDHAPPDITPSRVAFARGALAVFAVIPRYDVFDRTDALVGRRWLGVGDVGRAATEGLPSVALVTLVGWLLLRRRELAPG